MFSHRLIDFELLLEGILTAARWILIQEVNRVNLFLFIYAKKLTANHAKFRSKVQQSRAMRQPSLEVASGLTTNELLVAQAQSVEQTRQEKPDSPSPTLFSRLFGSESSGSNESCGTYITCKMSQMEETAAREFNAVTESAGRERLSEANMFNLTVQDYEQCRQQFDESPVVTFLSSPSGSAGHSTSEVADVAAKRPRVSSPLPDSSSVYPGQHPCTTGTQVPITEGSDSEGEHFSIQPPFPSFDGSDNGPNTDTESSRQVGSTLAEALLPPPITRLQQEESEYLDTSAPDRLPIEDRIPPLGGRSRALIKEYFAGNEISNLPKGQDLRAAGPMRVAGRISPAK